MSNQRVLPHALVVALQSVWMIQMIHAMVNYCPTATNGGLKTLQRNQRHKGVELSLYTRCKPIRA